METEYYNKIDQHEALLKAVDLLDASRVGEIISRDDRGIVTEVTSKYYPIVKRMFKFEDRAKVLLEEINSMEARG